MRTATHTPPIYDEEEITITLPAHALEALGIPLSGQLSSGHGAFEGGSSAIADAVTRNQPFPCFKKHEWGDGLMAKIAPQQNTPKMA